MTRKTFLGGFGAAFGSAVLPATAFAKAGEPIMRFGVASDVHIAVGWKEVVFSITPRDCYRVCGDELLTAPVVVNP